MSIHRFTEAGSFSPEDISTMVEAYEAVRKRLHDRGQPELVNDLIAKRILELAKLHTLNADELALSVLASFGLRSDA
jgi:hypothetical protein